MEQIGGSPGIVSSPRDLISTRHSQRDPFGHACSRSPSTRSGNGQTQREMQGEKRRPQLLAAQAGIGSRAIDERRGSFAFQVGPKTRGPSHGGRISLKSRLYLGWSNPAPIENRLDSFDFDAKAKGQPSHMHLNRPCTLVRPVRDHNKRLKASESPSPVRR